MRELLWVTSVNHALIVGLLVAVLAALTVKPNTTRPVTLQGIETLNGWRERKPSTTPNTVSKPNGYGPLPLSATYAASPSNQATTSKPIMSNPETQTLHFFQHTDYATNAEATPPSPPHHTSRADSHQLT